MATITYRGPGAWGNGSPSALTILQVDTNFYNLNENKLEKGDNLSGLTNKSAARTNLDLGGLPAVTSGATSSTTQYLRGDGTWVQPPTNPGTVTRVQGTGTVAGITLTGDFNSSGYLTLGGTLSVSLTSNVSGTLPIANGGTGATTAKGALSNIGAAEAVHTHNYLPTAGGTITGYLNVGGLLKVTAQAGVEGGQLELAKPVSDTSLAGDVVFDIMGNFFRIYEKEGTNRGISLDITGCGAQSILLHSNNIGFYTAGSCSGNAATATKLSTARSINGTSFDGSANITTANWGTSRTITIGSAAGKSVNGSGDVSWTLAEIGAADASHSHGNYITNSGASYHTDGTLEFQSNIAYGPQLSLRNFSADPSGPYLIMCSSRGTRTAPSATLNGDILGILYYEGYANASNPRVNGAVIRCTATGAVVNNMIPAQFEFQTVNNFGTLATRMIVDSECLRPSIRNGLSLGASGTEWNLLYVTQVVCNGAVACGSDLRLKTNVKPSDLGLDFVLKLNPVKFNWISDVEKNDPNTKNNYGFIAQEVEELLNDPSSSLYKYDSEHDKYFLAYDHFIAPLTKAIQEQQEIINNLKARIEALEAK